jgi:hypothetical protein
VEHAPHCEWNLFKIDHLLSKKVAYYAPCDGAAFPCIAEAPAVPRGYGSDRWVPIALERLTVSMIFRFTEMKQAEGFVRAVKERFQLDGQVFDNEDAAQEHDPFPGGQIPPIAHIDRVDRAPHRRSKGGHAPAARLHPALPSN